MKIDPEARKLPPFDTMTDEEVIAAHTAWEEREHARRAEHHELAMKALRERFGRR